MAALDHTSAPPGISKVSLTFTDINFVEAFDFIKGKLSDEFLRDHWQSTLGEAMRACYRIDHTDYDVLDSWLAINFLDILWSLLFGKTAGLSPWNHLLRDLAERGSNGSGDHTMDISSITDSLSFYPKNAEKIIRQEFKRIGPIRVFIQTTSPSDLPSKRSARDDLQSPRNKIKPSSKKAVESKALHKVKEEA
ncbi:hypothetical protein F4774DRAFT_425772 [Daldinia eschscholtzii]|nr:hypothetical protein F4774DRAFT_425772 [Daldinia eschscholtzii]